MASHSNPAELSKPGLSSPTRPKHQVTRSITEASHQSFPKLHRPHHHHNHTSLHHRDKIPQSAHANLQPYASHIDVAKSEGVTPDHSREGSRRASMHDGSSSGAQLETLGVPGREGEKRIVREGEVKEEREKGVLRATELRNALMGLNTLSNNTTRRLDNTYYAVLEKLSVLQSNIVSFKELAAMTRQLNAEFKTDSEEAVGDIETQLASFKGFEEQQKRIEGLQERVIEGRERIKTLAGRVDIVRDRVEGWQKAEGEWQEKTRRRLRMLWILMATVAAAVLALMVFQYTPARTPIEILRESLNGSGMEGLIPELETIRNENWKKTGETLEKIRGEDEKKPDDDPRLRLFDEL